MIRKHWVAALIASIAVSTGLIACGGGTSNSSSASGTTSAQARTASGVLSAFGSVFVNGAEYAVIGSTTVVDGDADDAASSAASLHVGMTLDVTASSGTASFVRYTSAVRGEVDAIDTSNSTLTVLGQPVVVSSGTSFAGSKTSGSSTTAVTQLGNVSVGDYVVVYGYLYCASSTSTSSCTGGTTQIMASLVYEPTASGPYRAVGYAESVNTANGSFVINRLTVDYTTSGNSATSCVPSPCAIADGDLVEVRSTTSPTSSSGTLTLAATRIKAVSLAPVLISGETVSIEGPVANLNTTADTFSVRGISVDGSGLATTVVVLSTNEIVEVTGTVTSSGSLKATAITVENRATFALMAPLAADSASADTIVVLGQTFTVNSDTKFIDRAQDVRPFNLSNFATVLSTGDQLVVSAYAGSSGNVATRVERLPTPSTAIIAAQGVVTAMSASADTLTIGGVSIKLNASTTLAYPGSGSSPSLTAFLDSIVVDSSVVTTVGTAGSSAGTMTATTAELLGSNCGWATAAF